MTGLFSRALFRRKEARWFWTERAMREMLVAGTGFEPVTFRL